MKMQRILLLTVFLIIHSSSCLFSDNEMTPYMNMPSGKYKSDLAHSSIICKVSHLGLSNYPVRFTQFEAELDFDSKAPENSKLAVTIDPTTIETHYPDKSKKDFNKILSEGEQWFNTKEFPVIRFTATEIKKTGENSGIMTGNLDFLGMTKPLNLKIDFNGAYKEMPFSHKAILGFSAKGKIKRSDWGMDAYLPSIGDEIEIQIEAEFVK